LPAPWVSSGVFENAPFLFVQAQWGRVIKLWRQSRQNNSVAEGGDRPPRSAVINRLLPSVAMLSGEYGEKDIAMGVSCLLNRQGMERMVDPGLNDGEMRMPR